MDSLEQHRCECMQYVATAAEIGSLRLKKMSRGARATQGVRTLQRDSVLRSRAFQRLEGSPQEGMQGSQSEEMV